jgi:RNA polymerase sigma-70 factor (ECF subfamily)
MSLLESEPTTMTPLCDSYADAELEAGLTKLLPFLRAFARSLSGNRELAEDLTQEVLAKVWQCRRSFTPGSNLKAWLFTILRNEFYSYQRRAWRQTPWDAEQAEAIPTAPGEQHWAVELSDTINAMNSLPDAQREALIMIGVGGFSYDDTAALSSCAVGTMKSRVTRARQSLREILANPSSTIKPRSAKGKAIDELLVQLNLVSEQRPTGKLTYGQEIER